MDDPIYHFRHKRPADVIAKEKRLKKEKNDIRRSVNATLLKEGKKQCTACEQALDLSQFGTHAASKDGHKPCCKRCHDDLYRKPMKDMHSKRAAQWQKDNPERTKEHRRKARSQPHARLMNRMRTRLKEYVKDLSHLVSRKELIGCSPRELVAHLERQFTPEMSWDNYGSLWHIDHILPCAAFDFALPSHLRWCWDYRNLRPLDSKENVAKRDTLPDGSHASSLWSTDRARLIEIVSAELDHAGIASQAEVKASYESLNRVQYIAI